MTLEQIIANVEDALGCRINRSRIIYSINEVVLDLALSMRVTRTDIAYNNRLPRQPVEIIDVQHAINGDRVTYTFVPRTLRYSDDVPELPVWCHNAIVTFVMQLYRDQYHWQVAA